MRYMVATSLLLLTLSCTMIPKMEQPTPPVPADWQTTTNTTAEPLVGWQDFFLSAPMRAVLQEALRQNRNLRAAALQVDAARALYRVERSDRFPQVDATLRATEQQASDAQTPLLGQRQRFSDYRANLVDTRFELDLFGRSRSLDEAALQTYFATAAARDTVQISLIAETANAYLQWLANRKNLNLSQETLALQDKSRALVKTRFDNGISSKLDLAQVRIAVESARADLHRFDRQVKQNRNALQLLMGSHNDALLNGEHHLDAVEVLDNLPIGVPSEVLLRRPDIQQAEFNLRAANANIGAARAAFFPRISLTGSYGFASNELDNLFSGDALGAWSFVPQITVPIFNYGRNKANLAYAELQKEIRIVGYEEAIQQAFREVADALVARETLSQERSAQQALVAAAQESYDLAYARYDAGIDSFLSVLDAQRALFGAQQRLIDIERQVLTNLVNLYKALGGGITIPDEMDTDSER